MAQLGYFLIAENIIIDQDTNQVSAFNILEEVHTLSFPLTLAKTTAFILWYAEANDLGHDFQSKLRLTLTDGTAYENAVNFTFHTPRQRIVQRLEGIPIFGPGQLIFEIFLNGRSTALYPVEVVLIDAFTGTPIST